MAKRISAKRAIEGVSREPTLYFVLIALALFGVSAAVRGAKRGRVIEIDRRLVAARIARIEAGMGNPLTDQQRRQVEEDYVDEQVLVREARSLGLEDDSQVQDLLAQKMLDVISADVIRPTDEELREYFEAHRSRYMTEATVTVDELVVGTTAPLSVALRRQLDDGTPPEQLTGQAPMHRGVLRRMTLDDLTRVFDGSTARLIFGASSGTWVGPHTSVRGQHWFRVTYRTDATEPPLDIVRDRVRRDWIGEQEQARLRRRITELRGRYAIVFTGEAVAQ